MVAFLLLGLLGYGVYAVWQFFGGPSLVPEVVQNLFQGEEMEVATTEENALFGSTNVGPPPLGPAEVVTSSAPPQISVDPPRPSSLPPSEPEPDTVTPLRRPGAVDLAPLPATASQAVRNIAGRAQAGDAEAQSQLAALYVEGQEVRQDYELAASWFERAAINGSASGAYSLGVLTQQGLGVQQNPVRAFDLFLQAAQGGNLDAQNAVGVAYAIGRGTAQNPIQAAQWFQQAYDNGNPRGAFNLGRLFEAGLNGPPDLEAARGWYRVAADLGSQDAVTALDRLTGAAPQPAQGTVPTSGARAAPPTTSAASQTPSTPQPAASTPRLSASDMREIQLTLSILGYQPGPVDGVFGGQTEQAIRSFQQDQGLAVTGLPTTQLMDRLRVASLSISG